MKLLELSRNAENRKLTFHKTQTSTSVNGRVNEIFSDCFSKGA